MSSNVFPFEPSSFSHTPIGPAVIILYDREHPIYITAVAQARQWLEDFHRNLGNPRNAPADLRSHIVRNAEFISFGIEKTATLSAANSRARSNIVCFLPWFNFPRELRELAGWKIPKPSFCKVMLIYAGERCLPATMQLLKCLMARAGQPLDLRKLFRASRASTMEEFVAAWDELVEEGLVGEEDGKVAFV